MISRHVAGITAALALVGAAILAGAISFDRTRSQLAVLEACERVRAGDFEGALVLSESQIGPDETGRTAAECRCTALVATGRGEACLNLLDELLADPEASGWTPEPAYAAGLIQRRRDAGRIDDAATLAKRAGLAHPLDAGVFHLELETRASVEDEEMVLRELSQRIPSHGDTATRMRVSLAQRYLQRGDVPRALNALGTEPAPDTESARGIWFDTRGIAYAMADDVTGARGAYAAWSLAGGDPAEIRARYALALSIAGIADLDRSPIVLLQDALTGLEPGEHPRLRETLVIRLILTLVNGDQPDEAITVYDLYREEFELEGLRRTELTRSARTRMLATLPREARSGRLQFHIADAEPGQTLLISAGPDAPPDAPYERLLVPVSGSVTAERPLGEVPQRWVLLSAKSAALASGTFNPVPGATLEIAVTPGAPRALAEFTAPVRRAPDGRRRVSLVLLDCADWGVVQYLRARGELPVLDTMFANGHRAVLDSDPPLTAAALEALVWPGRRGAASFVGLVHQFGTELSGLSSIGENPVDWLRWILPESEDLFAVIGAGELSAANLLLAHGAVRAGRHGEITGPGGIRELLPLGRSARDLTERERTLWPELAVPGSERDAFYVRSIAAEFDLASDLIQRGEIDLIAIRIEPLDILTHAHFADIAADGQDDGEGLLLATYRYIDARVGELQKRMDADDVLIVMSDHGIRTAMEHSRDAIFVAVGAGIPAGRAPGRPGFRGVSRVVADLLGVTTEWPDTGIAPPESVLADVSPGLASANEGRVSTR